MKKREGMALKDKRGRGLLHIEVGVGSLTNCICIMVPGDDLRLEGTEVYFYREYKTYPTGASPGILFAVMAAGER